MDVAKFWGTTPIDVKSNWTRKEFKDAIEYMHVDCEMQYRQSENKKGR